MATTQGEVAGETIYHDLLKLRFVAAGKFSRSPSQQRNPFLKFVIVRLLLVCEYFTYEC